MYYDQVRQFPRYGLIMMGDFLSRVVTLEAVTSAFLQRPNRGGWGWRRATALGVKWFMLVVSASKTSKVLPALMACRRVEVRRV